MNQAIRKLEQRVAHLEDAVFGRKGKTKGSSKQRAGEFKASDFSGPTGGVRLLISQNFFKSEQGLADVRAALKKNGYHGYVDAVIQTTLNRQSKRTGPLTTFKEAGKKMYANRK